MTKQPAVGLPLLVSAILFCGGAKLAQFVGPPDRPGNEFSVYRSLQVTVTGVRNDLGKVQVLVFDYGAAYDALDYENAAPWADAMFTVARCRWDLDYDETVGLGKDEIRGIFNEREQRFHPYTEGSCALHSGHLVHQIGPIPETVAGDARITLQGHALRCGGVWRLYW